MRVAKRQPVVGVRVGRERLSGRGRALAAQHTGQPAVGVERLGGLFVAGPAQKGQACLHFGGVDVQCRRAVQQALHGRVVGVAGVGQVATGDEPFPCPLPAWTAVSIGSNQQARWRTRSAHARCRARCRGPRRPPGSAAWPARPRRSRRAAPQRRRPRCWPARSGYGPGRARTRSAALPCPATRAWRGRRRGRPPARPRPSDGSRRAASGR